MLVGLVKIKLQKYNKVIYFYKVNSFFGWRD